jgi:hypothetical protein
MDHMIRQARHCGHYEAMAIEVYEKEPIASSARQRMEANAAGTPLYAKMKQIDFGGVNDLFRRGLNVTNNTFNISGGIQGGAVSLGGDAENSGATSIHYNPQTVEVIRAELSKAERELQVMAIDDDLRRKALDHVRAAKVEPTPDKISNVIEVLDLVTKVAGAGTAIGTIVIELAKLLS